MKSAANGYIMDTLHKLIHFIVAYCSINIDLGEAFKLRQLATPSLTS
jgi:hypothetical protein